MQSTARCHEYSQWNSAGVVRQSTYRPHYHLLAVFQDVRRAVHSKQSTAVGVLHLFDVR